MEKIYLFYMVMGFCLGSILFAYEIPRMVKHVDIRQISEDGNPGTFNAFAAAGVGWGNPGASCRTAERFFFPYICAAKERGRIPCYLRECWLRLCLAMPFPFSIREKAVRELQSASACCLDFFHGGRLC